MRIWCGPRWFRDPTDQDDCFVSSWNKCSVLTLGDQVIADGQSKCPPGTSGSYSHLQANDTLYMKIWGILVSQGNTFLFFKDNQIFSIWISHEVLCSVKYSHFSSVWKKAACYRRIGLGSLGKETHIGHSAVASPPHQATPHFESQLCHLQNEGAGWGPLKAICPQGQAAELLPKVSSSWLLVLEHKGTCDSCRMERIAGHTDDLCRLWRGPMLAFPYHRLC